MIYYFLNHDQKYTRQSEFALLHDNRHKMSPVSDFTIALIFK